MKKCGGTNSNKFDSVRIFGTFLVGLSVLTMAAFGFLTSSVASADDTVIDVINITVPVACTMTSSPNGGGTYTATMTANQYKDDFGSTTFSVVCNDPAGFGVYAIGYGNNTLGTTDMINSTDASQNIATGTATSGNISNWAMKLTPVTGTSAPTILNNFSNFHAVPSSWTKVAEFNQVVASSVGSSFTSTYAVWVSGLQPAGTYTGKVKYELVHPSDSCMTYTVHFNANNGTGSMDDQVICAGTATSLTANTFTPPTGYEFLEWNTEPDGSGASYDDGESVTDIAEPNSTINLYATWDAFNYNIAYTMNNGTCTTAPTSVKYDANVNITGCSKTVTTNAILGSSGCVAGNNAGGQQTFAGWTATNVSSGATTGTSSSAITTSWNGSTTTTNQWFKNLRNDTGTVTMVASWSPVAFNLPTFTSTPTGHTCKWFTDAEMTTPTGGINGGGSYTPAANSANTVNIYAKSIPNKYTCTKRYRLENADGTWGNYVADGTEQVDYNTSCQYEKTMTDYKNTAAGNNNAKATGTCTITTNGCTVSLDLYRNTYTLTVNKDDAAISSASASTTPAHGTNYYRWNQVVSISATANTGAEFTSWTQSGTAGVFANANNASTTFTMGKGNATITANGRVPINLYNEVASKTKGTQTLSNLQSTISTSNSGVYTYNSSVFGTDTDGTKSDNTKATIYYYRGILDSSFTSSTYGSGGDGALTQNYVILSPTGTKSTSDTCWRIIRTTGSGGVKMIYNGKWTGSTCANVQSSASTGTGAFNTGSGNNPLRRIALSGYTFNTYGSSTSTTNTSVDTIFGSNTNFSNNTNSSTIKSSIETWYNSNLSSFTNILEPNAGYCNDRTFYSDNAGSTVATQLRPSGSTNSSGTNAYSAGYFRNSYNSSSKPPSLRCSRDTADVYSTSTSSGGNGQLSRPIALITADELSFAGAGAQTANQGSAYSASSYVRSGSNFWTMTPYYRTTGNSRATYNYRLSSNGYLSSGQITTNTYTIRPVISLIEGTLATDGSGTAADPWVVEAP